MTAAYLHKKFGHHVTITLVEAATIPRIGVGEATVPNLQTVFFDALGIPEDEWMRGCNAAFKGAVKFINWRAQPQGGKHHFYHPFGLVPTYDGIPLTTYWAAARQAGHTNQPVDYACFKEPVLLDNMRAFRTVNDRSNMRYAWHFDAQRVAEYLCNIAVGWGVHHVVDQITNVTVAEDGGIGSVTLKNGQHLTADLFIDCSGFVGLLINKALGEPFIDMSDHLLCDSAVATSVFADEVRDGIEPYTSSIAMRSGWTWKIPMLGRIGSGYVYSSKFASKDEATRDFLQLWNLDDTAPLNHIRFRVGRNRRAWVKNCVSIGLASCFVEPLESTGIYFIYAALHQLARLFPDTTFDPVLRDEFNQRVAQMFDDSLDFIQAHYLATGRSDTPFWLANQHDLHLSDNIRHKLELYDAGLPINQPVVDEDSYYRQFESEFANYWTNGSYYCILAGLGRLPKRVLPALRYRDLREVDQMFAAIQSKAADLNQVLPTNYQFLHDLHG